ncbi:unnamed protein product [Oppiella nova]|uniref:F-box domain-containing protein n=1 Tax=Oppiella nova TaxID=334625 RepID=A0A7R9M9H4_9ACAR|nr:unnamed protein product [Oppiella nova]CAG2173252.1 unnamed protein product [Oppiella nova]
MALRLAYALSGCLERRISCRMTMCGHTVTPLPQWIHLTAPVGPQILVTRRGMAARSSHTMNAQKVYPKDSLDRLGDDLCQHLLSFLSLEDRFRCECVSKQWQRVIYKTQHELIVTEDFVKLRAIEKSFSTILKKCQNITKIAIISPFYVINNSNPMLDSIARHCHHLTDICFNFANAIRFQTYDRFFAKFAKQLKSIEWTAIHKDDARDKPIVNNIKCCDNLTQFNGYYYYSYFHTSDYSEKMCLSYMKSIDVEIDRRCNEKCIDILMTDYLFRPFITRYKMYSIETNWYQLRETQETVTRCQRKI